MYFKVVKMAKNWNQAFLQHLRCNFVFQFSIESLDKLTTVLNIHVHMHLIFLIP